MSTSPIETSSSPKSVDGISRSVRVLVVDNDIVHARTMGEGLERLGYKVIVAGGGNEGAQQIREESFDVVVTDLMMNDIGGLEILNVAKTSSAETEVIVVTGHGTVPSAVEAMQQGAFTYLQKPLELAQLRVAVEKASAGVRLRLKNLELKKDAERIKELESVVFSEETNNESLEQWKVLQNPDKLVENLTSLVSTLKTIKNKKSEVLSKKKLDE